jgi:hypothetical protein
MHTILKKGNSFCKIDVQEGGEEKLDIFFGLLFLLVEE